MPLTPLIQKSLLDFLSGAAAFTEPTAWWFAFATASPNSTSAYDGPFTRLTVSFAAANSPQGSVTNLNAISARATAVGTAVGWNLYNGSSGSRIAYGTLSAALGCRSSTDIAALGAGALKITLA